MTEEYISVEQLAKLCSVDRETIRRWRKRGIRGVMLESVDTAGLRGKPVYFTKDAVRRFAEVYPKMMTEQLAAVLMETEETVSEEEGSIMSVRVDVEEESYIAPSAEYKTEAAADIQEADLIKMMKARQKILTEELQRLENALKALSGN